MQKYPSYPTVKRCLSRGERCDAEYGKLEKRGDHTIGQTEEAKCSLRRESLFWAGYVPIMEEEIGCNFCPEGWAQNPSSSIKQSEGENTRYIAILLFFYYSLILLSVNCSHSCLANFPRGIIASAKMKQGYLGSFGDSFTRH